MGPAAAIVSPFVSDWRRYRNVAPAPWYWPELSMFQSPLTINRLLMSRSAVAERYKERSVMTVLGMEVRHRQTSTGEGSD